MWNIDRVPSFDRVRGEPSRNPGLKNYGDGVKFGLTYFNPAHNLAAMTPADLQRALAAFDLAIKTAGSYKKLGEICGCTKQNLHIMRRAGRPLSHQYVLTVERELDIPRQHLRPDLYPQEKAA